MHPLYYLIFLGSSLLIGCTNPDAPSIPSTGNPSPSDWLIPRGDILDGGPGKDGIPSVDNPSFTKASEVDFLNPNDLILGIKVGDEIKAYPHPILDWHEIVNDEIGDEKIALTYCPLTGTGIGWDREINGRTTEFGVSGLLFNTNLMPYDRETNSTWSQQRLDCVNGELIGTKAELHSYVETTWSTWQTSYPESQVMNTNTGFSRNYQRYPYGDYRTNGQTIFPIDTQDDRLHPKTRVLGVLLNNEWKAYAFSSDNGTKVLMDQSAGPSALVVSNSDKNYIVAFKPQSGQTYTSLSDEDLPAIIEDSNGVRYDILGSALNGSGSSLQLHTQFIGYWFSWGTFYPDLELEEQ